MDVLERLKKVRQEVGLSQVEMASLIGVTQPTLCAWERGKRRPKSRSTLLRIEEVLARIKERRITKSE